MLGEETDTLPFPAICPDWYPLVQAAKYLNVAPWDLMEQSVFWEDIALTAISAEANAQKIRGEHQ